MMRLAKYWYDHWGWMTAYPGFGWLTPLAEKVYLHYGYGDTDC